MSKFKLHYLNLNAKANFSRALFCFTETPFENIIYTKEELNKIKIEQPELFEYKQLPVLEVDGVKIPQAISINTYLSQRFNLYGDSPIEGALITGIFNSYEDIIPKFRPIYLGLNEYEKQNSLKFKSDFLNTHAPMYLGIYERRFRNNNTGFMIGKRFSGADIWISVVMFNIFKHPKRVEEFGGLFSKHAPLLEKHVDKICGNQLKEYFNSYNKKGFIYESLL